MTQQQSSAAPEKLSGPQTKNPGAWPYADAYDEVTAANEAHLIRYEDEHIRLVEVAYFPGIHTEMHGSPYPSVIARDSAEPEITNVPLEPNGKLNGQGAGHAPPPKGMQYPVGITMAPLGPHAVTNNDTFPLHYYKVEFKRIDGDDYPKNWKTWYPWMLEPLKPIANIDPRDPKLGPPLSEEYPFAAVSESYIAAPNNHYVRYQDDHIVLLEVVFRPGERENLHGHADASVFARDIGASPQVSGPIPIPSSPPPQPATNIPGFNEGAVGDWKLVPGRRQRPGRRVRRASGGNEVAELRDDGATVAARCRLQQRLRDPFLPDSIQASRRRRGNPSRRSSTPSSTARRLRPTSSTRS